MAGQTTSQSLQTVHSNALPVAPPNDTQSLEEQAWIAEAHVFLQQYEASKQHIVPEDTLNDRFAVHIERPLPQFDTKLAKAYEATDMRDNKLKLYALVLEQGLPYRIETLSHWESIQHRSLLACFGYGELHLSALGTSHMVLIMQRPKGKRLSDYIASGERFSERDIQTKIIRPLKEILEQFQSFGINHGRINPDNIYFGEYLELGEALSEPAGYSQDFVFEPIERLLCAPIGKGSGFSGCDTYALAIMALYCYIGKSPLPDGTEKFEYIHRAAESGIYNVLTSQYRLPDLLDDLLRGSLNDAPEERWGLDHMDSWLAGKRYNMNPPTVMRESSRAFEIQGRECFTRRSLAQNFTTNWLVARNLLKDNRLIRWIEMSMHRGELADSLRRAQAIGLSPRATDVTVDEMVSRSIQILDPSGPVRMNSVAFNIDGAPALLADAMATMDTERINYMLHIFQGDMLSQAFDMMSERRRETVEVTNIIHRLQNLRLILRNRTLGFGIERCLYEMNPLMPCQSPIARPYHISSPQRLLWLLDAEAGQRAAAGETPLDAHSAAYLAFYLQIKSDISVSELSRISSLAKNPSMIMLKLLVMAQRKFRPGPLPGLAMWMVTQLEDATKYVHQQNLRKALQDSLIAAAKTGDLEQVARYMLNGDMVYDDQESFTKAVRMYHNNKIRIRELTSDQVVDIRSKKLGRNLSVTISYLVALAAAYLSVSPYTLG